MKRIWIGAVALVGLIGCGSGTVQHIWVANAPQAVPAGVASCQEGPYQSPSGASIFYDIGDSYGDDMDVSIVAYGDHCDGSSGYAVSTSPSWAGRISPSTGSLPGGLYQLAITCYNLVDDCTPLLYSFGYED